MSWGEKEVAHLRARWGQDTPRVIAEVLGMSRNAVIGKAHRLGLPDLGNPVGGGSREKHAPKPRGPYVRRDESGKLKVTGVKAARLAAKAEPVPAPLVPPLEPEVVIPSRFEKRKVEAHEGPSASISELQDGQCVWPVQSGAKGGEHRFCGQPADPGKPYCADHRAKAKGRPSAMSMEIGRENARRQSQLSHAKYVATTGTFIRSATGVRCK